MDSVVASVSGYSGLERFNLIKLINRSGASYVGNMTPKVTHLVCKTFHGKKYEFAKRFRIVIVNHCWIEECVNKGRRVSETPFTFLSGEEMGPLCLDIQVGIDSRIGDSKLKKKLKAPIIDVDEYEDTIVNDLWDDSILFSQDSTPVVRQNSRGSDRSLKKKLKAPVIDVDGCEDTIDNDFWDDDSILISQDSSPVVRQNSRVSDRLLRKAAKRSSRKDHISNSRHCENPPEPILVVLDKPGTSQPSQFRRLRKRSHTSQEPDTEASAVVKMKTGELDKGLTSNIDLPQEVEVLHEDSIISNEGHRNTDTGNLSDQTYSLSGENNHTITDVEEAQDMNDELQNECNKDDRKDLVDGDVSVGPSITNDLSCVICWTEFSSTRGVLPCGHRFCFSCIQNWADHMGSQRKTSTCPLCKAHFTCITKVDDVHSSDQKIYSQTFPYDSSKMEFYILPDEAIPPPANASTQVCYQCFSREPEDLLIRCHLCNIRCVHIYCLDPPLTPWKCLHCQDLRMLYTGR